jgi:predicted Zn-dependent protease
MVQYSQALDALDKKDKAGAKKQLQQLVKEQPDFVLASLDLEALMK